jgi:hypothetical protein
MYGTRVWPEAGTTAFRSKKQRRPGGRLTGTGAYRLARPHRVRRRLWPRLVADYRASETSARASLASFNDDNGTEAPPPAAHPARRDVGALTEAPAARVA